MTERNDGGGEWTELQRRLLIRRRDGRRFTPTERETGCLPSLKRKGMAVRSYDGGDSRRSALVMWELTPAGCAEGHRLAGDTEPESIELDEEDRRMIRMAQLGLDPFHVRDQRKEER